MMNMQDIPALSSIAPDAFGILGRNLIENTLKHNSFVTRDGKSRLRTH
jgi:hypothetical protein